MSTGEKLKFLRAKTRKTLKEQSKLFGVSLNSLYRWEHDLAMPRRPFLKKMADIYDVPMEWLLYGNIIDNNMGHTPEKSNANEETEQQFLKMYRKLPNNKKYKIIGYVERILVEANG